MRRHRPAVAALLLGLVAVGCDSLPDAIGPTARDLLSTFTIWNRTPASLVHVLVHPITRTPACPAGGDSSYGGGVATFRTPTGQGRDINVPQGCYVFFLRWEGVPGHTQIQMNLGADDYRSYDTPRTLAPPPEPGPLDGSLRVVNAAAGHTASISRIYTDACVAASAGRPYGTGAPGGVTTDNVVSVAHGESVTIPMPRACHLLTVVWSNGAYEFGTYTITGANFINVGD